jgi:glycosyltransferase involved in cell wall biosynthesis
LEKFQPHPDWKLHAYSPARGPYSACVYYRIEVPFLGLQKLKLAECFEDRGTHHYDKDEMDRQSLLAMLTSDINLFYSMDGDRGAPLLKTIQDMKSGMLGGKLCYPPSNIYDIDDNLDWVHPFNDTFSCYGTRTESGGALEAGAVVKTLDGKGEEHVLWIDGKTRGDKGFIFNVERNKRYIESVHEFARGCDGFTTPSRHLAEYHAEHNGYHDTYVFPNSIVPEHWYFPKLAPRKKEVRILWQGGGSHMSDWFALRPALTYIAKKYPHVKFVIFGQAFKWVTDAIPAAQLEVHPWVPYEAYRYKRAILDCDINLCVLRDDEFSRSKSAIKFYEGSLGPLPEATLAPNMPPYNEEIEDGKTGLLYDPNRDQRVAAESFAANLSYLIENAALRRKLGEGAKAWVLANRHYLKTVPDLYEYYMERRLKKMKDKPYTPETDSFPSPPVNPNASRAKRKAAKARKLKK